MRRPRKHITLIERLASALADKLPPEERDVLRRAQPRIPARVIVAMFTPDHIDLHSFGGADKWWNLDMRRRGGDLKAKDRADTSRAAKAVRIDNREAEHKRALLQKRNKRRALLKRNAASRREQSKKYQWPSRPFPKRSK